MLFVKLYTETVPNLFLIFLQGYYSDALYFISA